jgi:hypothetical protein
MYPKEGNNPLVFADVRQAHTLARWIGRRCRSSSVKFLLFQGLIFAIKQCSV